MREKRQKKTNRHISNMIRKLNIKDGDVIAIKEGSRYANKESIDEMGKMFELHYPNLRCVFVVVDDWKDLETVDEETMLAAGWMRWPRGKQEQ